MHMYKQIRIGSDVKKKRSKCYVLDLLQTVLLIRGPRPRQAFRLLSLPPAGKFFILPANKLFVKFAVQFNKSPLELLRSKSRVSRLKNESERFVSEGIDSLTRFKRCGLPIRCTLKFLQCNYI